MKTRSTVLPLVLCETLLLLAIAIPVAHVRSLLEHLLLPSVPPLAPGEAWYVLVRSLVLVLALQLVYAYRDLYRWNVILRPQIVVMRLVECVLTVMVVVPVLHHTMGFLDGTFGWNGRLLRLRIHPLLVVASAGTAFLASYGLRMRWPRWMNGRRLSERVLIAGHGPAAEVLAEEIRRHRNPAVVLVEVQDGAHGFAPDLTSDLAAVSSQLGVQRLILGDPDLAPEETLVELRRRGVHISDAAAFYEDLTGKLSVEHLGTIDVLASAITRRKAYEIGKRLLDISVASIGLLLTAPLCLLVATLIRLESKGPALYRQQRTGRNDETFTLIKFRSMRVDAEEHSGPVWATSGDARITRVGRWLRKLRIDELPQLWSVLVNDMSLVGPRPERPFFIAELEKSLPDYSHRHLVKPGITGWAQVNYPYGNSEDDAFLKLQFDLFYLKHRSLALDISILLRTVKVVVLQQGAL